MKTKCQHSGCKKQSTKTRMVWSMTYAFQYPVLVCDKHFSAPERKRKALQ